MLTNVTESSLRSYDQFKAGGMAQCHVRIIKAMLPGRVYSRRQLALFTGLETSSVAGRVFELIELGELEVCGHIKCPITGKSVEAVKLASEQGALF